MTKIIFSRDAYVASRTRAYMSYDKMTYKQAVRAAIRDFNSRNWTKECDGEEVHVDVDGHLVCVEVRCDD